MSKIQEALNKLQSEKSGGQSSRNGEPAGESKVVGKVVKRSKRHEHVSGTSTRIIEIDRKALRKEGLLAPEVQERTLADQYRIIKRPLIDNVADKGSAVLKNANLIMVASALPGDGKTTTAINLALSIAIEKDKTVLLVDADVAKPHVSRVFGLGQEPGLIEILKDQESDIADYIFRTDVPGLAILPAGQWDPTATELLASRRMARLASEISAFYPDRMVIFDSPPLLSTSEAPVLASRMGQVVIVVKSNHTPQHAVIDAIEKLDEEQAVNLVLNQSNSDIVAGYYGYGYGNYGSGQERK